MQEAADTRTRLLDAGERLFAEHGFAGTSVRAITAAAKANLNSVNYHFGSKEGLFRAVVHRFMNPLTAQQLRRLSELEAERAQQGTVPSVEELIAAYASPFTDLLERDRTSGRVMSRLVIRVLADANGRTERAALAATEAAEQRYLQAFARALPHLAGEELWWRFQTTALVIAFHWIIASAHRHTSEADFGAWMRTYLTAAMSTPSA